MCYALIQTHIHYRFCCFELKIPFQRAPSKSIIRFSRVASSIGTCAKKLFQNPPTYPSFQPFQHEQRALPAASKNSISQLRERNVDRANLRSEVRPPGKGFRAKSRKEVSLHEKTVRGLSRTVQQTTDKLNPKSLDRRKHHKTEK